MSVKIGSNIASLQAQRRLGEAGSALETVYERLSSGQRINKAADDAAGLAIAQSLNSKSRVFGQALRNINDGVSLFSIADSTINALSEINLRLSELAQQAANGTYSSTQREAIDNEAQALAEEYFRVSRSAQFNGQRLFDGTLSQGIKLQMGYGVDGSLQSSVGGELGTGAVVRTQILDAEDNRSYDTALGDLNGDGILDLVSAGRSDYSPGFATVRLGLGEGNFGQAISYAAEDAQTLALALGDLNDDGILDLITAGSDAAFNGRATVRLGLGNGQFGQASSFSTESQRTSGIALGDLNGDGILDIVTGGYNDGPADDGYTTVRLGIGNGSFGSAISYVAEAGGTSAVALGDLNNDGILDIVTAGFDATSNGYATVRLGTGNGSFGNVTSYLAESRWSLDLKLGDLNRDGILDLITSGTSDGASTDGYATVRLGTGSGSFGQAVSYMMEAFRSYAVELGDMNGDGILDLVTAGMKDFDGAFVTIRLGQGNGSFGQATSTQALLADGASLFSLSLGDLDGDGVTDIIASGYTYTYNGKVAVLMGQSRDGISPLQPFSLSTKSNAKQAIGLFENNRTQLSNIRGTIGAIQSRLSVALNTIGETRENYISASSRITDADVAQESSRLVRLQILQQAGAAVLAQANQQPQIALTLLR